MVSLEEILADLNRRLDAEHVLCLIGSSPDKVVAGGPSLKAFCPIHGEKAFHSLIIDSVRKRYKCSSFKCAGFSGGDLPDLYAKARRIDPRQAAFELAGALGVDEYRDAFAQWAQDLAMQANEALARADANAALPLIALASALAPRDAADRRLHAQILRTLGREDEAVSQEIEAAAAWRAEGDAESARELLRGLYAVHPERTDLAERLAEVLHETGAGEEAEAILEEARQREAEARARGPESDLGTLGGEGGSEEALAEAIRRVRELQDSGLPDEAERLFLAAVENSGGDPLFRQALADWLVGAGKAAQAALAYGELGKRWLQREEPRRAIDALCKAEEIKPADPELRKTLAMAYSAAGDPIKAHHEFLAAAGLQSDVGEFAAAAETLTEALAAHPRDVAIHRALIAAAAKLGDEDGHLSALRRLADLLAESGSMLEAAILYREALERAPDHAPTLEALERLYETHGAHAQAAEIAERRARLAEASGQRDEAAGLYAAAAQGLAEDVDAQVRLADALFRLERGEEALLCLHRQAALLRDGGRSEEAAQVYEGILRHAPGDAMARGRLAECYEMLERFEDALNCYRGVAESFESTGSLDNAIDLRRRVARLDPSHLENLRILIRLLLEQGNTREAGRWLAQLADNHESQGDLDEAVRACQMMLERGGDELEARRRLARLYLTAGALPDALRQIEAIVEERLAAGCLADAEEWLHKGLEAAPRHRSFRLQFLRLLETSGRSREACDQRFALAHEAIEAGERELAVECVTRLRERSDLSEQRRARLIELCDVAGLVDLANEERLALAEALLGQGQIEEAKSLCDEAIQRAGESWPMRRKAATLYQKHGIPELALLEYCRMAGESREKGRFEEAAQVIEEGLRIRPNMQLRALLIDSLISLNRLDEACAQSLELVEAAVAQGALDVAESQLRRLIQLRPDDPPPRQRLADVLRERGDVGQLEQALRELAPLLEARGDTDGALQACRELLTLRPDDLPIRQRYIQLYSAVGPERDLLDDYLILAQGHAKNREVVEAMRVYERLLRLDPAHLEARRQFIRFLADQGQHTRLISETLEFGRLCVERGEEAEACEAYEHALQRAPRDKDLLRALGETYARRKMTGRALEAFQRLEAILADEGDTPGRRDVLKRILDLDPQSGEQRAQLITLLREAEQDTEAEALTLAQARQYEQRGLPDLAEQAYREALARDPENIEIWRRLIETRAALVSESDLQGDLATLGDLLARHGQLREALEAQRRLLAIDPDELEARRRLVDIVLQIGERPEQIQELLELADRLRARGEWAEALERYSAVLALDPGHAQAQARRAEVEKSLHDTRMQPAPELRGTGSQSTIRRTRETNVADHRRLQSAIVAAQNLLKVDPNNPNLHAQLAEAYDQLGMLDQARDEWDAASQAFFDLGDLDRCVQICETLLERNAVDPIVRHRLSKAVLRRDSLLAIDKALSGWTDAGMRKAL
ncbi:MAG: tetratricopeptide repeat protein [Candidatus Sumerlaeota bacterium]|nr:tetratricopeptide repeat protein [Candidatus Sumerlaeota bacterium]